MPEDAQERFTPEERALLMGGMYAALAEYRTAKTWNEGKPGEPNVDVLYGEGYEEKVMRLIVKIRQMR